MVLNQSSSGDYARVVAARRALEKHHPVRQLFTLLPQTFKFGQVRSKLSIQRLDRAFGLTIGCLQTLNLPDLPMEFFDASGKHRASFRQIGEVLLSG